MKRFKTRGLQLDCQPHEAYLSLMCKIASRFKVIKLIKNSGELNFSKAETCAFHGRKIVEGIAYACLIAIDHSKNTIPRDSKGQWNAEIIFKNLKRKNINSLPSPSIPREATNQEKSEQNVTTVLEGVPSFRLTHDDLINIYKQFHSWLHEINPYVENNNKSFYSSNSEELWSSLEKMELFLRQHNFIISGEGFYCTLFDKNDGMTKVVNISKIGEI